MAAAYRPDLKRFRFSGLIELNYTVYNTVSTFGGSKTETEWTNFEQRYSLGIQGYVYHPKLLIFSSNITFVNSKTESGETQGNGLKSRSIDYELGATFLPGRPISLEGFAIKSHSTIKGLYRTPYESILNLYYARLIITKSWLPVIKVTYEHWDHTTIMERGRRVIEEFEYFYGEPSEGLVIERKRVKEKTERDSFFVDVSGYQKAINTRYTLEGNISEYSSILKSYTAKSFRINTYTIIKNNSLSNNFLYSDLDFSKILSYRTQINLSPIGRFHHNYSYEYIKSETEREKSYSHNFKSYWLYRFSRRFLIRANLWYGQGKRDGTDEDSYDINLSLNYGKLIKNFDFTSNYGFTIGKREKNTEAKYMIHNMGLGLARKFRWGKVYLSYDLSYRTIDFTFKTLGFEDTTSKKSDDIEHIFRVGASGKGPRRAYWLAEMEARFLDTKETKGGAWRSVWFGGRQWAEKIRHYTLRGNLGYPFGRKGTVDLQAGYTTGTTNLEKVKTYYYEGKLKYRILRNLDSMVRWREEWQNRAWRSGEFFQIEEETDYKIRDFELYLYYNWRRIYLSLEYTVSKTEKGPQSTEEKRLFLQLRRPI